MSLDWLAGPGSPIRGEITVPGDKSISHRALMLAAIADGDSRITGFLEGDDTRATARILEQLGVRIDAPVAGERVVHGVGLSGLRDAASDLDCGNAGTAMRLLGGLLAGQAFSSRLIGDASLSARPMKRLLDPLLAMGARVEASQSGTPPLMLYGKKDLQGIDYTSAVPSAQLKSAVLLAGLFADGETIVREPRPTRDYTERMLEAFGWPIDYRPGFARLTGGHRLHATDVVVPSDFSSAAFFIVAATLVPGSDLSIRGVGMNPRRTGLLSALALMGADISQSNRGRQGGEPVADLRIRHAHLKGIEVPEHLVADMIDEFPAFFVAAALADGTTCIRGAAELRVKESDRLAAMSVALTRLGIKVDEAPDGATIEGGAAIAAGQVDSLGDHRIAMSLAVAAQLADGGVRISDCGNVSTSFPGFVELAQRCGMAVAASPATASDRISG